MALNTFAQQFDLSAELRPRYENRHGFGTLLDTDEDGSNFVSQPMYLMVQIRSSNNEFIK